MKSDGFLAWFRGDGQTSLNDHLSDQQLRDLGVDDSTTATAIGRAIGEAIGAVAFKRAAWVERELLARATELTDLSYSHLHYLEDIWELLAGLAHDANVRNALRAQWKTIENSKIENNFAMDDWVFGWINGSNQALLRVGFRCKVLMVSTGRSMADFDSGEHNRWVTMNPSESREWSLLQLLLSNPTPFANDVALRVAGLHSITRDPSGLALELDAYQEGGEEGHRLEAKFCWLTDDPFYWPIRLRSVTTYDVPS